MAKTYDVVVLGTGNAGMAAAGVARKAGLTVAMVESRDVGGTCPIRGCVPKKVLVAAAQVLHQIDTAAAHHIEVGPPKLDWAKLIERERGFVDGVPEAFTRSLESRGIALYEGRARFVGPNQVRLGDTVLEGKKIVVATGSKPRPLAIPGAEHLITSDDILEMTTLPETLVFIGGGVIALEVAHVLARAGTKVTILEALVRLLPRNDADAVAQVAKESARIGIDILTDVKVEAIVPRGNRLAVRFTHAGTTHTLLADRIANGTGRVPDLDGLDLDAAGIAHDGTRVTVDANLRSVSNRDVFGRGRRALVLGPAFARRQPRRQGRGPEHRQWRRCDPWLCGRAGERLHGAGACECGSHRGRSGGPGPRLHRQDQRHDRLALIGHPCRDRCLFKGAWSRTAPTASWARIWSAMAGRRSSTCSPSPSPTASWPAPSPIRCTAIRPSLPTSSSWSSAAVRADREGAEP